eukprot:scaffold16435_cov23-Tisochrysis_lutea.AAC.1
MEILYRSAKSGHAYAVDRFIKNAQQSRAAYRLEPGLWQQGCLPRMESIETLGRQQNHHPYVHERKEDS